MLRRYGALRHAGGAIFDNCRVTLLHGLAAHDAGADSPARATPSLILGAMIISAIAKPALVYPLAAVALNRLGDARDFP